MDQADAISNLYQQPAEDVVVQGSRKGMKYSTCKTNPDGLSGKEIKQLQMKDIIPCRNYKKRTLKQLSVDDQIGIIKSTLAEYNFHEDVAR